MSKLYLDFYCRKNFGDDLFASLFVARFLQANKIFVVGNPFVGLPKDLRGKTHYCFSSYVLAIFSFFSARVKNKKARLRLEKYYSKVKKHLIEKSDAFVKIGGSIFMDYRDKNPEIIFSISQGSPRDFSIKSTPVKENKLFVIGANFGPVFHDSFVPNLRKNISGYSHVTVRDYSSYILVKDLKNVQYAPDVGFCTVPVSVPERKGCLVISVVQIENHTRDQAVIDSYYQLICQSIQYWKSRFGDVVLMSLCEREGDWTAIKKVKAMTAGCPVETFKYTGEIEPVMRIIASAEYLICSRFHSMIVGFVNSRKLFPIAYNCKTSNYLLDIPFCGKYATLDNLQTLTVNDVFYNFDNQISCDVSLHLANANNQFYGLSEYLKNKEV